MLATSNEIIGAWLNHSRQLSIRVKIDSVTYGSEEITSLSFDSGSISGEVFQIGSTYMNSVQIVFPSIIESIAEDIEVIPELGVMVNGSYEYTKLGHFYVDDFDRNKNNNTTSITATDKMRFMESEYISKLTFPKAYREVALDVANSAGVEVNTNSFASLGIGAINNPEGYTHRQAIGLIAQFEGGFASFNRNGELEIRRLAPTTFEITPESYLLKGFTKNESSYRIGGISVKTGEEETDVIRVGSTNGSQVELENKVMTQTLLNQMWELVKTLNYFPYELKWRGCPPLEAGDWIYIADKDGTKYSVPNLSYSITFNGGMSAESKATTSSTSQATYKYRGSLNQRIDYLDSVLSANKWNTNYYGSETPETPKEGDIWFKPNGQDTEIWVYKNVDGVLKWAMEISSAGDPELLQAIEDAKQAGKEAQLAAKDAKEAAGDAKKAGEDAQKVGAEAKAAAEAAGLAAADAKAVGADAKLAAEDAKAVAGEAQIAADDAREVGRAAQEAGDQALSLVDQAQKDIDLANETIGAHTIDLSKLFSDFANMDTVVDAIVIDTGEMKTAISDNEVAIETVKTEANKAIADNAADIIIAQQAAESAKAKADAVEATTHTITEDLNGITETITNIESTATSTTKTLNEVKSTVEGQTQTIATVKTTADSALSKSTTNSNTINGIETTLTETKATATSALTKANSAQSTADGNTSKITSVTTTANSALSKANAAQSTADGNTSKITAVTTTANSALNKANVLEETVGGVTRTLTSVESTISNIGAPGTNLLINGGFENDLFGWTGDSVHKIDTTDTHSGTKALMVDASGSIKMLNLNVKIPVYQGQQLEFSMWYKTSSDFNGTSGNNKLRVGKQDGGLLAGYGWDGAVTEWSNRVVTLTVGSGISELTIRIDSIHSAGKVWWDDISITDVTNRNQTNSKVNQISDTVDGHTQLIATTKTTADSALVNANKAQSTADGNTSSITSVKTTADSALSKANIAQSTADGNTGKITAVTTTANSALSKANILEETVDGVTRTITSVQTELGTKLTDKSYSTSSSADVNVRKWTLIAKTKLTARYQDIRVGIDFIGSGAGNSKTTLGRIYLNHKQQAAMGQNSLFEISISDTSLVTASDLVAIEVTTKESLSEVWYYMKWSQAYTAFRMVPFSEAGVGRIEYMATQPFVTDLPVYNKISNGVESGALLGNTETVTKVNQVSETVDGHTQLIASTKTTADSALTKATQVETTVNGLKTTVSSVETTANSALNKATQVEQTAAGILQTVSQISSTGSNMVTNSSFENDFIGWGNSTRHSIDTTSANVHTGSKALKIAAGSGITSIAPSSNTFPVIPGRKYEISYWYKTTSDANGTTDNQKLRLANSAGSILESLAWSGAQTEWTRNSAIYTAGTNIYEWRFSIIANHTVGTVWWDDISIIDVTDQVTLSSQITQLSDAINLKVSKNDVVNQINLSTGGILIAGNKIQITGSTYISDAVIKTAHIADLAVSNGKIANLAVTEGKIGNLAVSEAKIASLAVTEGKIGDAAITNAKIGNLAVSEAKIASLAVTEAKVGDAAITNAKIGDLAVSTAKIADLAVSSAKIANLAVTETKIGDAAITNAKIGNLAVSTAKIADGAIVNAKIGDAAITNAKIQDATISSAKIISLDVSKLSAGTIDTSKITIYGGSSTNYVQITTNQIEQKGLFTRIWQGTTTQHNTSMFMQNGYFRARNNTLDRSLYFSDFGISTFADGDGDGVSSGTINFFDQRFGTSNGLTLNSKLGVVALESEGNRVVLQSKDSANITSTDSLVVIRPYLNQRSGSNTFIFGVQGNSSTAANETHGLLRYGSEEAGYSSGLRFNKVNSNPRVQVVDYNNTTGGNTVIESGVGQFNSVDARDGNQYIQMNGSRSSMMNFFVGRTADGTRRMGSDYLYESSGSGKALHITSGGTIVAYSSSERFKEQIQNAGDVNPKALLTLDLKSWIYKSSYSLLSVGEPVRRIYGLIAEDVEKSGLKQYVEYDKTGRVEGYKPELWTTTIPILKDHEESIEDLKTRVKNLEEEIEALRAA